MRIHWPTSSRRAGRRRFDERESAASHWPNSVLFSNGEHQPIDVVCRPVLAERLRERVFAACAAPHPGAPVVQHLHEGAVARAVAEEALA
jgi:hypothetical protein